MNTTKADQMRQHIEQWLQSGQNKKEFCRDHQLAYSQFKNWCAKFGYVKRRQAKAESDFISLQAEPPSAELADSTIEIAYPNGVRLSAPINTPLNILRALVRIH